LANRCLDGVLRGSLLLADARRALGPFRSKRVIKVGARFAEDVARIHLRRIAWDRATMGAIRLGWFGEAEPCVRLAADCASQTPT